MEKLTKGIRGEALLCINTGGIQEKYFKNQTYLSMTGRGVNLPVVRNISGKWKAL